MGSPGELEAKAEALHELARKLRTRAGHVATLLDGAKGLDTPETWRGAVADEFGTVLSDLTSHTTSAHDHMTEVARSFDATALSYEQGAADARREQREKAERHDPKGPK